FLPVSVPFPRGSFEGPRRVLATLFLGYICLPRSSSKTVRERGSPRRLYGPLIAREQVRIAPYRGSRAHFFKKALSPYRKGGACAPKDGGHRLIAPTPTMGEKIRGGGSCVEILLRPYWSSLALSVSSLRSTTLSRAVTEEGPESPRGFSRGMKASSLGIHVPH